ncbi:Zinc knuckle CX2CX4HX4C [Parasponia andersonii]|uniref:Zinc knuckle CX2CX4HX4C n=1 Tax=Parasponia andersonii TaxID=3476 RepID=A0A2P5C9G4_PARAD|nr:Zinc knuckle CX2CX4HX4C [Parasponia andersonii]
MRVRVKIDADTPLRNRIHMFMIEVSREVSLLLQYDHLPDFCYDYGVIGHHYKECTRNRSSREEPTCLAKKRYGLWLNDSVPQTRTLEEQRLEKKKSLIELLVTQN